MNDSDMQTQAASEKETDPIPIDEVARRLGVRASAIRYYEERGLVQPVSRRSGRRWYGPAEIRRLAIIQYWQRTGLMSLEEIGDILAGPAATRGWAHIVQERVDTLRRQAERMNAASDYLEHVLSHHRDSPPDGCHHYESRILHMPLTTVGTDLPGEPLRPSRSGSAGR
ncbi:MerR family transcriptional regulator [Frankia sp. AgPm24]|uniref:MerR family transcriptional regulator n=1 Tax=Frankia sp. AgPm24 TaxID=631128 RepID=UPI0020106A39|nr:MerR family transcriptional regulator [Frankia sp. AgPm24]MCK9923829.1 MerR family transcriptional regulator [Frankia sp. AgPm24]